MGGRGRLAIQTGIQTKDLFFGKKKFFLLAQDRREEGKINKKIYALPGYENNQDRKCKVWKKAVEKEKYA